METSPQNLIPDRVDRTILDSSELKRRRRERWLVAGLLGLLFLLTGVEIHLLRVSNQLPFVNSIFFFGLMNLNIVLIMLMLFLVFRNAVKLVLDERKGRMGSRLKTRLVFCFLLFAIIPTVFLFTISALYIRSSFDQWFNIRIGGTLERSIDVVNSFYQTTKSNASHFAREVSLQLARANRSSPKQIQAILDTARSEYGLDGIEYYPTAFSERLSALNPERAGWILPASIETLRQGFLGSRECKVLNIGTGELVRCPGILSPGQGLLLASYFVPMRLSSQLSDISITYEDFRAGNPLNYPMKSAYFTILLMVTLLILFAATWTGFYVARRLTGPLDELARGTEEVALGNLDYVIPDSGSDEMDKLIQSFNRMTLDLKENKHQIEAKTESLRNMNDELAARRRYIEVLLESVHSGVVSIDRQGLVSMWNSSALNLLQLKASEIQGRPYWEIVPTEYQSEFRQYVSSVQNHQAPLRREFRMRKPDGQELALLVTLSALQGSEEGSSNGVVAVLDNVTDIKKVERMTAWREVAKRIAHEIKNPLTPIQLSVQRLRRRYLDKIVDDGTFDEATGIILKEVDSLKNLVSEFSAFARLPEISPRTEDLNGILIESVNLFRSAHEAIRFELTLADDLPPLFLDRPQLKRVLVNLFDNAVSAMEGAGRIWVSTEHDKELGIYRLSVADEGCGIAESAIPQLFEPYFSTKSEGTGLGLAIVQKIVSDHGGFVRVGGRKPKGSVFAIEFSESIALAPIRSQKADRTVIRQPEGSV